jgi:hypothetical protein
MRVILEAGAPSGDYSDFSTATFVTGWLIAPRDTANVFPQGLVKENIMRATTAVSSVSRAYALAFGLGLAILGMGVSLAHGQPTELSGPAQIAPIQIATTQIAQGLLPPVPNNSFVCHAQPGGWCDLRDWRGFDQQITN